MTENTDTQSTDPPITTAVIVSDDNDRARSMVELPPLPPHPSTFELMRHAFWLAKGIAPTEMVPSKLRNRPNATAALMLLGAELGVGPMTSLQKISVTPDRIDRNGKEVPGGDVIVQAQLMRGIARKHGHMLRCTEYSATRCTWTGARRDDPDFVQSVTYTIDDAKKAGLVRQYSNWEKDPRTQLSARASAQLCRILFEDDLAGMAYTSEEAADIAGEDAPVDHDETDAPTETAPKSHRRSARATVNAPPMESVPAGAPTTTDAPVAHTTGAEVAPGVEAAEQSPASPPVPAATWEGLAVPGDAPPAPAGPTPEMTIPEPAVDLTERPVVLTPGTAEPPRNPDPTEAVDRNGVKRLYAMLRPLGLDKAKVALALSGGRTTHIAELFLGQAQRGFDHLHQVETGYEHLVVSANGNQAVFSPISKGELQAIAKNLIAKRFNMDKLGGQGEVTDILKFTGWNGEGMAAVWVNTLNRKRSIEVIDNLTKSIAAFEAESHTPTTEGNP